MLGIMAVRKDTLLCLGVGIYTRWDNGSSWLRALIVDGLMKAGGEEWHETMGMSAFGIFSRMEIGIWIEGGGVAAL